MSKVLASGRKLPTAVFCHTDEMAFRAMAALRAAGLRCPDDLSLAAFDDHPMSRWWGLTTVSQHAHEQGVRAANAMIRALDSRAGWWEACRRAASRSSLVRHTTGPAPAELAAGEPGSDEPASKRSCRWAADLIKLTAAQQDFADWEGDRRCPEISDAPYAAGPRKVQHR